MTPEQQRIAIAKACGWKEVEFGVGPNSDLCLGDRPMTSKETTLKKAYLVDQRVPDYLNDLNAMHEAEKVLNGEQCLQYVSELAVVRQGFDTTFATAAQRAEAFLRTLNLWTSV